MIPIDDKVEINMFIFLGLVIILQIFCFYDPELKHLAEDISCFVHSFQCKYHNPMPLSSIVCTVLKAYLLFCFC